MIALIAFDWILILEITVFVENVVAEASGKTARRSSSSQWFASQLPHNGQSIARRSQTPYYLTQKN